jgi:uncharacterized protein YggU (UPF0235/DUF167 family)
VARPRTELPSPADIRALADASGRLALRVTPGARIESMAIAQGKLVLHVREKPDAGKANAAVLALLAKALGCAPSRLELLRGAASRDKLVLIEEAAG